VDGSPAEYVDWVIDAGDREVLACFRFVRRPMTKET
jgi:hypothetical protein